MTKTPQSLLPVLVLPRHVAKFAAKNNLQGAAWLAGVPGTIGGALAMNAGCYGTEMWEQVIDCVTIDRHGQLHTRTPADFEIAYRHVDAITGKAEEFFVSARLRFQRGDATTAIVRD
ncbi:MAG: FAD-binding protein [Gammaproteobacteria bacterium]|nr:FAD-binding protein [Gammaproteobacteria bacterium]